MEAERGAVPYPSKGPHQQGRAHLWLAHRYTDESETEPYACRVSAGVFARFRAQHAAAIVEAAAHADVPALPDEFTPDSCQVLGYPSSGDLSRMQFHQDTAGAGWVFLISVGARAHFAYYHPSEAADAGNAGGWDPMSRVPLPPPNPHRVALDSGDAILFHGEAVCHGVEGIDPGTEPEWWTVVTQKECFRGVSRVSLHIRDQQLSLLQSQLNALQEQQQSQLRQQQRCPGANSMALQTRGLRIRLMQQQLRQLQQRRRQVHQLRQT